MKSLTQQKLFFWSFAIGRPDPGIWENKIPGLIIPNKAIPRNTGIASIFCKNPVPSRIEIPDPAGAWPLPWARETWFPNLHLNLNLNLTCGRHKAMVACEIIFPPAVFWVTFDPRVIAKDTTLLFALMRPMLVVRQMHTQTVSPRGCHQRWKISQSWTSFSDIFEALGPSPISMFAPSSLDIRWKLWFWAKTFGQVRRQNFKIHTKPKTPSHWHHWTNIFCHIHTCTAHWYLIFG